MSSNLWEPAVPCHEPNANILVPVHYAKQSVLYRSTKQNHKVVKKMFSYHFKMHLFFVQKTSLCRPRNRTQTFRYRSIKQKKRFCYRLSKQKTTLRTMSFKLWDPAVPCHEPNANILVPVHEPKQSVLYRSSKQNHKIVKKMFSYHFNMHLFCAITFLCRPSSRTQTFRYRSIKQNKRFCYRLSKQNKTTLRTMSSNFL